jgi:hypothetical protein
MKSNVKSVFAGQICAQAIYSDGDGLGPIEGDGIGVGAGMGVGGGVGVDKFGLGVDSTMIRG